MTPGARIAAAIEVLDAALAGKSAEQALTAWARRSRFAGSGDRRAVRDLVFDALRRRRSYAALGGAETGRGLMIGALRHEGTPPDTLMTGVGHAPPPPQMSEAGRPLADMPPAVRADLPDWLFARLLQDHGAMACAIAQALRDRAPVFVRVNTARIGRGAALDLLAADGIATRPVPGTATALEATEKAETIKMSSAYLDGLVELQDASSQGAVLALPLHSGARVLDYCAGGGGKALAIAARMDVTICAHDAAPQRMRDLPARAARAGHRISERTKAELAGALFDLVLVDAPCSGSGTWRRDPGGKWRLSEADLDELAALQSRILTEASAHVRPGGHLAYATCSVLRQENDELVSAWCASRTGWGVTQRRTWLPGAEGDGFFLCVMRRSDDATLN